jgi:hypothetical protein
VSLPEISAGPNQNEDAHEADQQANDGLPVGLTPPGRNASRPQENIGTEPIISGSMPEGMNCSAHETSPLPPSQEQRADNRGGNPLFARRHGLSRGAAKQAI